MSKKELLKDEELDKITGGTYDWTNPYLTNNKNSQLFEKENSNNNGNFLTKFLNFFTRSNENSNLFSSSNSNFSNINTNINTNMNLKSNSNIGSNTNSNSNQ